MYPATPPPLFACVLNNSRRLGIWESPRHPLRNTQLEDFYSNLVWAPILDYCFLSFPSTTIVRKESTCNSTASRKNRNRTLGTRMRQGRRLDGVIRTVEDNTQEFGGIEVARTAHGGRTSTKWLSDTEKLLKALRDMLGVLCGVVGRWKEGPGLQVVGVVCAGLKMQVIRMGHWREGAVAVVSRERIVEVPVEVQEFKELVNLLVMVATMKVVVQDSVQTVKERHRDSGDAGDAEKSNEQLLREIFGVVGSGEGGAGSGTGSGTGTDSGSGGGSRLGWAADTPPAVAGTP